APLDVARHLVLPTITLALVDIGQFVLITRSSLIDVLTEDFITTAKAKGMSKRRVVWHHGMRNAMLPVVTASALCIGLVVGGARRDRPGGRRHPDHRRLDGGGRSDVLPLRPVEGRRDRRVDLLVAVASELVGDRRARSRRLPRVPGGGGHLAARRPPRHIHLDR